MNPMQTFFLVGMVLALTGCNRITDQSPTEVFMAMNNALCRSRDAAVLLDYVTAASKPIVEHLIMPVQQHTNTLILNGLFERSCVGEKADIQVLREVTDKQVAVITYLEGKDIKSIRLLRENSAWKINITPPVGSIPRFNGDIPLPSLSPVRTSVQI